jgi:putative chitinase
MDLNLGLTRSIIDECHAQKLLRNEAAYVLATPYWETNHTMQPVREAYYLLHQLGSEAAIEAWRKRNLRYWPWYGRGLVQLTWEPNYVKAQSKTGIRMHDHPDLAMDPVGAVKVLVTGMKEGWFTGRKLSDFIDLRHSDFFHARQIINRLDKASEIAHIADAYDDSLKAIGYD